MPTDYPSNLTREQYELLRELLPPSKPGGRPREVDLWEILNAIFYVLVEGIRWRGFTERFSGLVNGLIPIFATGNRMGLGCKFMTVFIPRTDSRRGVLGVLQRPLLTAKVSKQQPGSVTRSATTVANRLRVVNGSSSSIPWDGCCG